MASDPFQLIIEASGLNQFILVFVFLMGYFILFVFFYNKKSKKPIWENLTGVDKVLWSSILGFGLFYLNFYILKWFLSANFVLTYATVQDGPIIATSMIFTFVIILLLLMNLFRDLKVLKKSTLLGLKFFGILLFIVWSFYLAQFFFSFFTPLSYISGDILASSIGILLASAILYGTYVIIKFRKVPNLSEKKTNSITHNLFKNKIALIFIIIFAGGLFSGLFLYPKISYGDKEVITYYFDGGSGYSSQRLDDLNRGYSFYPWKSLKSLTLPVKIEYPGIIRWIPIDYGESRILVNETIDYFSFSMKLSDDFVWASGYQDLDRLKYVTGFTNISLDENHKKIILFFNPLRSLNLSKVGYIEIRALEYEDKKNFVLDEPLPIIKQHKVTFYLNGTNYYDRPLVVSNFNLGEYHGHRYLGKCRIDNTGGKMTYIENGTTQELICNFSRDCLNRTNSITGIELESEISDITNNLLEIERVRITPKTNALLHFNLTCYLQ